MAPPPLLPARPIPQIRAMPQPALAALPPPRPVAIRQPIQPPQLPIQPIVPQAVQQIPPVPVRREGHAPRVGRGPGQVQVREQNVRRGWEAFFHEIEDEAYEGNEINTTYEIMYYVILNLFLFLDIEEQEEDCIICYDRPSTVTLIPCRHTFCNICVTRLVADENTRCPLCRGIIRVYLNYDHPI